MTEPKTVEPVVEVYWRPGCPYCRMLLRPLRRSGLHLREINIWDNPEAAARVRSVADGNETVPTVFIGDRAMVNPTVRQVMMAARGEQPPPSWWTPWTSLARRRRPTR
jgi:mycoredoxin